MIFFDYDEKFFSPLLLHMASPLATLGSKSHFHGNIKGTACPEFVSYSS
jgi:hypothetical protein